LDAALPQTQCTRCGYPDCRSYAQAMASGEAPSTAARPAAPRASSGWPPSRPAGRCHWTAAAASEGPRALAVIDEAWCIGCTLCIKACPVDCIVGASKLMHTVIEPLCTGCELCVPVCPVDCIAMVPVTAPHTGWQAWSPAQAEEARERYAFHQLRVQRERRENDERLAAKAQAKLADLAQHSQHTDPAVLAPSARSSKPRCCARARAKRETGP
jgi:electron transport complex protein RnfB